jgi:uncharacterized protein YijF (DUF1287 family)
MNLIKTSFASLILFCAATTVLSVAAAQNEPDGDPVSQLVKAAIERTTHRVWYNGSYQPISYPGGDVPDSIGVCTDLVTWILPGNLPHIGIVTDKRSRDGKRPLVVHNIGAGPAHEDVLFEYDIDGHFRYFGELENQR